MLDAYSPTPSVLLLGACLCAGAAVGAQTLGQEALVPQLVGAYVAAPVPRVTPANFPPLTFASARTELRLGDDVLEVSTATATQTDDSLLVVGTDRGFVGADPIVTLDYDFAGAAPAPTDGESGYRYDFTTTGAGATFSTEIDGVRTFGDGRLTSVRTEIGGVVTFVSYRYDDERLVVYRTLDTANQLTPDSATFAYLPNGRLRSSTLYDEDGELTETHDYDGGRLRSTTSTGPDDADDYTITYSYTDGVATGASVLGPTQASTVTRVDDGSDADVVILEETVAGGGTYRTVYNLRAGSTRTRELTVAPVTVVAANPLRAGATVYLDAEDALAFTAELFDGAGRSVRRYNDAARALQLPDLAAGAYVLVVRAAGYAPLRRRMLVR